MGRAYFYRNPRNAIKPLREFLYSEEAKNYDINKVVPIENSNDEKLEKQKQLGRYSIKNIKTLTTPAGQNHMPLRPQSFD